MVNPALFAISHPFKISSTLIPLFNLSSVFWFALSSPNFSSLNPAFFIKIKSSCFRALNLILHEYLIFLLYPLSINPLHNSFSHSPVIKVPESSNISFALYLLISIPISSRTFFTLLVLNLGNSTGHAQNLHFPHQQSLPDII